MKQIFSFIVFLSLFSWIQVFDEIILGRIAENNIELQRQDHEKEVETLKEEIKRLKEERVSLQRKMEEGGQVNSDLQEQVIQLTKHVKAIPELRRDLNNMQNQRNNMDRKMKEQSEQARGTDVSWCNSFFYVST